MSTCKSCGNSMNDADKFCSYCGKEQKDEDKSKMNNDKSKISILAVFRSIGGIVIIILFIQGVFPSKLHTAEADNALYNIQYEIGQYFKSSEVDFKVIKAKNNDKFIIKCTSDDSQFEELYGASIIYCGYERTAGGGKYYRWINVDMDKLKEEMDW